MTIPTNPKLPAPTILAALLAAGCELAHQPRAWRIKSSHFPGLLVLIPSSGAAFYQPDPENTTRRYPNPFSNFPALNSLLNSGLDTLCASRRAQ